MKTLFSGLTALAILAACLTLPAQVGTDASVLGIVKDSSDSAIPGAQVTVTNLETGLVQHATADARGSFEILALPRGFYSVTVSSPGFSTWQLQRIELTLGEQKRISPVLRVGEVKQEVTVEAGVELVQTEKASLEMGVEQEQIRELPLNGRDPVELVALAPSMRYLGAGGLANEHTVQGAGQRSDQTGFSIDGLDANDPSNEKGTSIPNLDTVAQFSVQTSNFTAENGRNPVQVLMVTKGGTNQYHGTLWEFHRNNFLDAQNAYAPTKPKLIRNQFGFSAGGPIIKKRTFFFISDEGLTVRQERIYNTPVVSDAMLRGDFSGRSRKVTDPLTNQQFPGNIIPPDRISKASQFFFPYLPRPNSTEGLFRAVAPQPNDSTNLTLRGDQQINPRHRAYLRWVRIGQGQTNPEYRPDYYDTQDFLQHNIGLNYNWTVSPSMLFTFVAGYVQSVTLRASPFYGKENLALKAGLQGIPTEGREDAIGLPNITFSGGGYAGISTPTQVPARFTRENLNGKASMTIVRSGHTIGFGYEWNDRRTLARHASNAPRGAFDFNGQYTGEAFADYLLGLLASDERNYPLADFAMGHSPYSAAYLQDFWKIHPKVTLTLGLRYDYWHAKSLVRNAGATFDPKRGKIIAADDGHGHVDLSAQPVAPYLAEATRGQWITATEAGVPKGLFEPGGLLSPRLGVAWRPFGKDDFVFRGGYGLYTSSYAGNITGSQIIGPPYWSSEKQTFSKASLQRWETAFPADPKQFITPSVAAAAYDVGPMKIHQFNVSLQKGVPFLKSAVTVSYMGNRGHGLVTWHEYNELPPGPYKDLQAARRYPLLSTVRVYENIGQSWYNSLQVKAERRFSKGFSYTLSYAFARHIDDKGGSTTDGPTPFAPAGYDRGRSELERRHVLSVNSIWQLPVGKGRRYLNANNRVMNGAVGGWQFSGTYSFISGDPLTILAPPTILGTNPTPNRNRPNLAGNPKLDNPHANLWFDPKAFILPAPYTFGSAGLGLIDGPGNHTLNFALSKQFHVMERKYLQFRWELFNAPNHVNLGNPGTTLNQAATGRILSAGTARQMQFGLKFVF